MNAIAAYRSRRVETASPLQILVMLFQELLRRIELGAVHLEAGRHTDASAHLHHAREILGELLASLRPVEGGEELIGRLGNLYVWGQAELVAAGRDRDPARVRRVSEVMMPILQGWTEVLTKGAA
jgi:flagellar protein FliS